MKLFFRNRIRLLGFFLWLALMLAACTLEEANDSSLLSVGKDSVLQENPLVENTAGEKEGEWKTAAPEDMGMDADVLLQMERYIDQSMPQLHSVVVAYKGSIVFEKYYGDYDKDTVHHAACSIKTVISSLVGIAIEEGVLESTEQKIEEFFPEYISRQTDPHIKDITIENLLTNTPGLSWNENTDYSLWIADEDPVGYLLSKKMTSAPGQTFTYNTACPHMLEAILTKAVGKSVQEYAAEKILDPLGISNIEWWTDKNGMINPGTALMTPRDMAKLGQLYLNEGMWQGRQLIPKAWLSEATAAHNGGGAPHYEQYGYQFWVTRDSGYSAYFGGGRGGQFIYVVPELDFVLVTTSEYSAHHENNRDLAGKYIIPSITGGL